MLALIGEFRLDPSSNEFATAKQNFEILEWSLFVKSWIFSLSKRKMYRYGKFNFSLAEQERIVSQLI